MIRSLFIVSGTAFVALGIIGIFLPVLPTTPFLLLAAYCYARSSNRFHHWLLSNPIFGSYIRNYREGKGLPRAQKALMISLLWLTLGYSAVYVVSIVWIKFILIAIAIGVTIHIVKIKTSV